MQFKEGTVVLATAGRDAGGCYLVVRCEGRFCWIADGRRRRLALPKKKNPLHLAPTTRSLDFGRVTSDRALRRMLAQCSGDPIQSNEDGR